MLGILVLMGLRTMCDRQHLDDCLTAWRAEIDSFWHVSDQSILLRVVNNFTTYRCLAYQLTPPQKSPF
jgi:hypothetical protein